MPSERATRGISTSTITSAHRSRSSNCTRLEDPGPAVPAAAVPTAGMSPAAAAPVGPPASVNGPPAATGASAPASAAGAAGAEPAGAPIPSSDPGRPPAAAAAAGVVPAAAWSPWSTSIAAVATPKRASSCCRAYILAGTGLLGHRYVTEPHGQGNRSAIGMVTYSSVASSPLRIEYGGLYRLGPGLKGAGHEAVQQNARQNRC